LAFLVINRATGLRIEKLKREISISQRIADKLRIDARLNAHPSLYRVNISGQRMAAELLSRQLGVLTTPSGGGQPLHQLLVGVRQRCMVSAGDEITLSLHQFRDLFPDSHLSSQVHGWLWGLRVVLSGGCHVYRLWPDNDVGLEL